MKMDWEDKAAITRLLLLVVLSIIIGILLDVFGDVLHVSYEGMTRMVACFLWAKSIIYRKG